MRIKSAASPVVRVMGPATRPKNGGSMGIRPLLGLSVTTPFQAPGKRREPPISVPRCNGPYPTAALAPPPALEPPGFHVGFQGFVVSLWKLDKPEESIPRSGIVVLAITIAPASRTLEEGGASRGAGVKTVDAAPNGTGVPWVAIFSLMVIGTPSSAPMGESACQRFVLASA